MQRFQASLVLDAHARLGEGPVWDQERGQLVWVDIESGSLHRFNPATGASERQDVGQPVGVVALCTDDALVLALRDGFGRLDGGRLSMIAEVEADRPGNRMNDGKVDSAGRFWAGTMACDASHGAGSLYRLDPDRRVRTLLTGLTIANGLDWSPEDRTMYFIDSASGGVDAFAYEPGDGAIANRRRLIEIPRALGVPDGMTVDAEGCLWVAIWGGGVVRRYTPDGVLSGEVSLPVSQVTSCAFGGKDLGDLYMTSAAGGLAPEHLEQEPYAGGLFHCRPGLVGRAAHRFRSPGA